RAQPANARRADALPARAGDCEPRHADRGSVPADAWTIERVLRGSNRRVGKGAPLQILHACKISRAVPTRSAFRVGKTCPRLRSGIAIDPVYTFLHASDFAHPTGSDAWTLPARVRTSAVAQRQPQIDRQHAGRVLVFQEPFRHS